MPRLVPSNMGLNSMKYIFRLINVLLVISNQTVSHFIAILITQRRLLREKNEAESVSNDYFRHTLSQYDIMKGIDLLEGLK